MTVSATRPEAVGERLRWAREQSGLSQGQVAKMVGFHRPTISQIEAGQRRVNTEEVVKFADLYGVKEVWIIKGDSALEEESDSRIELVARELAKLRKNDFDEIVRLIRVLKSNTDDES